MIVTRIYLRCLISLSLVKGDLGYLIKAFKFIKGIYKVNYRQLFRVSSVSRKSRQR